MVVFCFFGAKTLREACIIVAVIYAILAVIDIIGSLIYIAQGSHWVYIMTLLEAVSSLPFHALLYIGAKKERATWVRAWLGYTLVATLPVVVIRLGVAVVSVLFYWILSAGLELVFRVWMWFQVRAFYLQLVNQGSSNTPTTDNPITPQQDQYDPPPPYRPTII